MRVQDRMTLSPIFVTPDDTVAAARAKMNAGKFRRLPVTHDGKLVGILSEYDLAGYKPPASTRVRDLMTANPITVSPDDTLEHAARLLIKRMIGALPVLQNGLLVGIISARDIFMAEPRPLHGWIPPGHVLSGYQR
jgi:CBS domain-containing protein